MKVMVKELPQSDRPHYRANHYGLGSLSNIELVQLITRSHHMDAPTEIMLKAGSLRKLSQMTVEELSEIDSVGEGLALAVKAALELGRRQMIECPKDRDQVKSPADAANMLMQTIGYEEEEHMVAMLLDSKNYVISIETVYIGSLNQCLIRTGEMFKAAIRRNAAAIIVAHNHPSGDPTPSPEDVSVTEMITQAGTLLDIDVLDHLVIGHQRYVSLKERGLGFK